MERGKDEEVNGEWREVMDSKHEGHSRAGTGASFLCREARVVLREHKEIQFHNA